MLWVLLRIVVRHRYFPRREIVLEGVWEGLCHLQISQVGNVNLSYDQYKRTIEAVNGLL